MSDIRSFFGGGGTAKTPKAAGVKRKVCRPTTPTRAFAAAPGWWAVTSGAPPPTHLRPHPAHRDRTHGRSPRRSTALPRYRTRAQPRRLAQATVSATSSAEKKAASAVSLAKENNGSEPIEATKKAKAKSPAKSPVKAKAKAKAKVKSPAKAKVTKKVEAKKAKKDDDEGTSIQGWVGGWVNGWVWMDGWMDGWMGGHAPRTMHHAPCATHHAPCCRTRTLQQSRL